MDLIRKHLQHEYICGANNKTNIHWDTRLTSRVCTCGCEEARKAYDELLAYIDDLLLVIAELGVANEKAKRIALTSKRKRPEWLRQLWEQQDEILNQEKSI